MDVSVSKVPALSLFRTYTSIEFTSRLNVYQEYVCSYAELDKFSLSGHPIPDTSVFKECVVL